MKKIIRVRKKVIRGAAVGLLLSVAVGAGVVDAKEIGRHIDRATSMERRQGSSIKAVIPTAESRGGFRSQHCVL